ncbi:hypothetical protein SDC9_103022 [bioreactor metagenome]|uniref:Uncharacterized protein n=1 Tax=bioreactor metagenome TaxID=1076179 RepID=A0A645ASY1_9ZZZZ
MQQILLGFAQIISGEDKPQQMFPFSVVDKHIRALYEDIDLHIRGEGEESGTCTILREAEDTPKAELQLPCQTVGIADLGLGPGEYLLILSHQSPQSFLKGFEEKQGGIATVASHGAYRKSADQLIRLTFEMVW